MAALAWLQGQAAVGVELGLRGKCESASADVSCGMCVPSTEEGFQPEVWLFFVRMCVLCVHRHCGGYVPR